MGHRDAEDSARVRHTGQQNRVHVVKHGVNVWSSLQIKQCRHRYLAVIRRSGVEINSGQEVRLVDASFSVSTGHISNLFPRSFK